jgi:hypothetical protein
MAGYKMTGQITVFFHEILDVDENNVDRESESIMAQKAKEVATCLGRHMHHEGCYGEVMDLAEA